MRQPIFLASLFAFVLLLVLALPGDAAARKFQQGRVEDRLAIEDVLTRYCRALDTKDWPAFLELFTENAQIDYTANLMGGKGSPKEIAQELQVSLSAFALTIHRWTNAQIEFDENNPNLARVRAMMHNPMYIAGFPVFPIFIVQGQWNHVMEKSLEDGLWRTRALREDIFVHWDHQLAVVVVLAFLFWRTRRQKE